MTLSENIALQTYHQKPYSKNGMLNYSVINEHARELIEECDVRTTNELVPAKALSGGNQQRQSSLGKSTEILGSVDRCKSNSWAGCRCNRIYS